jgi:hypothetical protein
MTMRNLLMTMVLPTVLAVGLVGAGCGEADPSSGDASDTGPDVADQAGKADGATHPGGDFAADAASVTYGQFVTLSLNADNTFASQIKIFDCIPAGNCGAETGTYKFTRSTSTSNKYIRFTDAGGDALDRYQYKLSGDSLQLRVNNGDGNPGQWFTMQKNSAAQEGESCGGFTAHPKKCADGLICQANRHIPDAPGTCVVDPDAGNACTASSDCSGILPQFCEQCSDGTTACAHFECVSNQCQIATCPAAPVANCRAIVECVQGKHWDATQCACVDDQQTGGACSADSDCSGILPQFCQQCSDGTTSCAHWACVSGQCQTVTCQ